MLLVYLIFIFGFVLTSAGSVSLNADAKEIVAASKDLITKKHVAKAIELLASCEFL